LPSALDLPETIRRVSADLSKEGYRVSIKIATERVVQSAVLRFPGLFHEMDLSGHRDETLAVRIEVDTNPPGGAVLETTLVRRHVVLSLQHHDRASLLAGKVHAVLQPDGTGAF
jgi:hypothetical protein